MFGTKFRTWMETHIVRSKKKKDRKKSEKGFDSNYNSPTSHSANRSPAPHRVHPVDSPTRNVEDVHIHGAGYAATVTTSSGTSGGTGSVSLSSPESAYSTGYSTDGTSPGASFPPEYYINIRTGTHYFQRNNNNNNNNNNDKTRPRPQEANVRQLGNGNVAMRDHQNGMTEKQSRDVNLGASIKNTVSPSKQTCQSTTPQRKSVAVSHRRTGSFSSDARRDSLPVPTSIPPPLVDTGVQSPRERSRIRTNPWLSATSSGSSTAGFKSRLNLNEESSSSSGMKHTESSGSASDVNVNSNRKEYRQESLSAGRSPINQNWRITGADIRPKIPLALQRRISSCSTSSSGSSVTRSVRSSEDDVTLNEMMGKFDESYVYEKETDILSDSDPTDCDDYIDSLSDVDTGQDGGDEIEPYDELDYIDNGSYLEIDNLDYAGQLVNNGHCKYFSYADDLGVRETRLRESFLKRRTHRENSALQRSMSVRNASKRQSSRHKKSEEASKSFDKRKKRFQLRRRSNEPFAEFEDETLANLNRVLLERMLLKNSGFNQGSRSVGGTPICLRRKRHDVNKNLSPLRLPNENRSSTRPAIVEREIVKRRSNSVSYVNGNIVRRQLTGNAYMTTFASEIALIEADKEADRKYRELIMEAENILVNMQRNQNSSPVVPSPSRKLHNGLANKRVELIKNTELNIELALSKSRNSQPELQSGNIRDIEHTSPKRQFNSPIHRLAERNSAVQKEHLYKQESNVKCPDSPVAIRRVTPQGSPSRCLVQARIRACETAINESVRSRTMCNGVGIKNTQIGRVQVAQRETLTAFRKDLRMLRNPKELDGITSSSSDSEEKCEARRKAPLLTFRSVDMGPVKEGSSYCPQSEPVKRKVYAGSATYGRIQKTLGEHHAMLRNSDGDTATDDTDDSRKSLKEKVAQLRQERLTAEANANHQDSQYFQQQITQIRRQMLMQTIEGLKRSLEDQSATLKQTCLEPVLSDQLP